jgi:biotin transport system permease protein
MVSSFLPGDSLVHRTPAGVKLAVLCLGGTLTVLVDSLIVIGIGLAVMIGLYAVARVPMALAWRMSRAIVVMALLVGVLQGLLVSPLSGALVAGRIVTIVAGANLLTVTTSATALINTLERLLAPLARFGVAPDKVSLALSLTLRFIPVIADLAARVREAQRARGVRSPGRFLVPVMIRTLRMAEGVGDALAARTGQR